MAISTALFAAIAVAQSAIVSAAAFGGASQHQLYGYGIIGNDAKGQVTQVAIINVTTAEIAWSEVFHVASTDSGCNVAFATERGVPVYYVMDGSMMQQPPWHYVYHTVATNGTVIRTVNASVNYDSPFVAWDPTTKVVYGIGSQPMKTTTDLFQYDPLTGATATEEKDLKFIQEMPDCVGANSGNGRAGYFYFINGVISKQVKQQLITYDAGANNVANKLLYKDGLISSIAGYTLPDGSDAVVAILWPDPETNNANCTLVLLNPHSPEWNPTVLYTFTAQTPIQGVLTMIDSTAYAGTHLLFSADISVSPPVVSFKPINDSHAFFGVWSFGGVSVSA